MVVVAGLQEVVLVLHHVHQVLHRLKVQRGVVLVDAEFTHINNQMRGETVLPLAGFPQTL